MTPVKKEIEIRILNIDKKKFIEDIIALGAKSKASVCKKGMFMILIQLIRKSG